MGRWYGKRQGQQKGESKQRQLWVRDVRVVDENVKLAAGNLGNLLVAGLDALLVGDIKGEGAHAHLAHLGQDGRVAGRGDDMDAFRTKLLVRCFVGWRP